MWEDPIIEETRVRRETYAARFNHDLGAIFEDICRRQAGVKTVDYHVRRKDQNSEQRESNASLCVAEEPAEYKTKRDGQ